MEGLGGTRAGVHSLPLEFKMRGPNNDPRAAIPAMREEET